MLIAVLFHDAALLLSLALCSWHYREQLRLHLTFATLLPSRDSKQWERFLIWMSVSIVSPRCQDESHHVLTFQISADWLLCRLTTVQVNCRWLLAMQDLRPAAARVFLTSGAYREAISFLDDGQGSPPREIPRWSRRSPNGWGLHTNGPSSSLWWYNINGTCFKRFIHCSVEMLLPSGEWHLLFALKQATCHKLNIVSGQRGLAT